jgi:hypothetical protein
MEPPVRYPTREAIDKLSKKLNLRHEDWMQDWPIEVVVFSDIEKYLACYETLTDEDEKFVLMEAIIDATENQKTEDSFIAYCCRVKQLLQKDFGIHEYTIHYWSCFETDSLEDCWRITPLMRQLWYDNKKSSPRIPPK